jgi:hypothetical protein
VMHPIPKVEGGYTAEVLISEIEKDRPQRLPIVRRVLNAGAALGMITTDTRDKRHYLIHADVVRALASINARSQYGQRTVMQQQNIQPINLTPMTQVEQEPAPRQITRHAEAPPSMPDEPRALTPIDADRLAVHYLDELLAPIGLTGNALLEPLQNDDIGSAAEDSWNTLYQNGYKNPRLGEFLRNEQRKHEARIDQAYRSLRPGAADDPRKLQVLDRERARINEAQPMLMLHPDVGLINDLIAQLEYAAGPDEDRDWSEQDLLNRLRDIQSDMRRLNFNDPSSWRRIEDALLASTDMPQMMRGTRRGPNSA